MTVKLIIVEGLPGSGKSTVSSLINDLLGEMGIDCRLYPEGDFDHPADFEAVALLEKKDFSDLLSSYAGCADVVRKFACRKDGSYLVSYGKLLKEMEGKAPEGLIERLAGQDIYELPLTEHIDLVAGRWQEFAGAARKRNRVNIFECCLMQNPITVTMIRDNAPREKSLEYIRRLAAAAAGLDPLLIYLRQEDPASSFRRVCRERPEAWLEFFLDYYTNRGYGRAYDLEGMEGAIQLLEDRQQLELEIFDSLEMKKVLLDNSDFSLKKAETKLKDILGGLDV